LFSVLTNSDTALVAFQYLLIQGSALFLLFTLFFFYGLAKWGQITLLGFMVLNPLFLHLANLVSSDGLFLALSLAWFALLQWIIHRPNRLVIIWHALVLFFAFVVRYSALVYPVISILAFLLSRQPIIKKLTGVGTALLLCGLFILYTGDKYKKLTGSWQYAPLSGWLIANNAVRAYRYVDSAARKRVPVRFKSLDNMIRMYFDSSRPSKSDAPMDLTMFMYPPDLFLTTYRDLRFKKDTVSSELKKWAMLAPLYADYGSYIIRQYPGLYLRHVLWPGMGRYYAPPVASLTTYNAGSDSITPIAKNWFRYKRDKLQTRTKDMRIGMLDAYPIFSGVVNAMMFCCLLCFGVLGGFKINRDFRDAVILTAVLWLLNAGLTIFATWAVLRFQSFTIMTSNVLTLFLAERIWRIGLNEKRQHEQPVISELLVSSEGS